MKRIFWLIMFIPLILKAGALYYYVDENGVYHFSDKRTNEKYDKVMVWSDKNLPAIKKELNINFDLYIKEASVYYGVDKDLIRAMIKVESDYDPYAVSRKGARGLMQLMPETAQMFRLVNPFHPRDNIFAGVAYFKALLVKYKGNVKLALAAYNAGPSAVDKYQGIPPYPETKNYVKKVLEWQKRYKEEAVRLLQKKSRVEIISERVIKRK